MTKYKVGDKLRYVGVYGRHFTNDVIYEVDYVTSGFVYVIDDSNDNHGLSAKHLSEYFELVDEGTPVEASPTVIELLANISRRLYEAERQLKSQAYEINELYKAVADRG